MKKVSIITVCIDLIKVGRKGFFQQMFDSVQQQSYPNIEHVIIDGSSKDGTQDYINSLLGEDLAHEVHFISEPDTGIYNAMNKGVRRSKGDYIIVMNTDDYYYDEHAIKSLVRALETENAEYACASSQRLAIGKKKKIVKPDLASYLFRMPFDHNSMLLSKELFERYGGFDEQYKLAADYDFIFKVCLDRTPAAVSQEIVTCFRSGGASSTMKAISYSEVEAIHEKFYQGSIPTATLKKVGGKKLGFYGYLKVASMEIPEPLKKELLGCFNSTYWKGYICNVLKGRNTIKAIEDLVPWKKKRSRL